MVDLGTIQDIDYSASISDLLEHPVHHVVDDSLTSFKNQIKLIAKFFSPSTPISLDYASDNAIMFIGDSYLIFWLISSNTYFLKNRKVGCTTDGVKSFEQIVQMFEQLIPVGEVVLNEL